MHTLEQNLAELVMDGRVDKEEALASATDRARLARLIGDTGVVDDLLTSALINAPAAGKSVPWAEESE